MAVGGPHKELASKEARRAFENDGRASEGVGRASQVVRRVSNVILRSVEINKGRRGGLKKRGHYPIE